MKTFIEETLDTLLSNPDFNFEKTTFILPSKRAGSFLKEKIKSKVHTTIFMPEVLSTEDFIAQVTQLIPLDNTGSIFELYQTYVQTIDKEHQESFDSFYAWAQTLIYDFNEIDRYLIDADHFFNYLSRIQDINHWSKSENQTDLVKNYLWFWKQLPELYKNFTHRIIKDGKAYQGLMYREASEKIVSYLEENTQDYIFIGFNALNTAEQKLIQYILKQNRGKIFWDLDEVFYQNPNHEASLFVRNYVKKWDYFKENPLKDLPRNYEQPKNIQLTGIPKNIGQAKYIAQILKDLPAEEIKQTAVVLNDESLLPVLLNSLPENVEKINITMGLPLGDTPLASLFESLFKIQEREEDQLYFKWVLEVLKHPFVLQIFALESEQLQKEIIVSNLVFISLDKIKSVENSAFSEFLNQAFQLHQSTKSFIQAMLNIIQVLRGKEVDNYALETEYLFHFNALFVQLKNILEEQSTVDHIKVLYKIYRDSLTTKSLDFAGSPFDGLQLMGMLETRVIDYKNVILTSVNEGVLPAGKSSNSFIPYDLKKEYGLPTYKEKDAVYTYHFYRLMQRAENIHILYNTEQDGLNAGEKSRFITQLEVEKKLESTFVNPKVPSLSSQLLEIEKTPAVIKKLEKQAAYGFSPSALTTYIRNPLDFYKRYVLGIKEEQEVEETVAANTLGTIIHDSLEQMFLPFVGKEICKEDVEKLVKTSDDEVLKQFKKVYKNAPIHKGKNLLIHEVAKRYLHNFFQFQKNELTQHSVQIISLEAEEKIQVEIPQLQTPVFIKGKVDRLDSLDGIKRIIDYKTGKVEAKDVTIKDWDLLGTDYKFSKAFQVLCYAKMILKDEDYDKAQGGIISFKNLKSGFLELKQGKETLISNEMMIQFDEVLQNLILEILNPEIPFKEKEV
ncbi:PD-(D/E)XK nuclease family protein [Mesonia sp. K4-1]|uniref:PD-(D/E)XK nuclease family protein n=1 Tax=Mesonia sp. K4-1 TaxID=2602760 RepID=UPI0011CB0853|nr:PD-(D/E)XK nuclease family protein [Mesonia sp. K4-1]TXK76648.1 PD-(D/E)XK nuclease family protein [Mesonia sp. K4-1]